MICIITHRSSRLFSDKRSVFMLAGVGAVDCLASDLSQAAKRKRFRGFLQEIIELLIYVKEKPVPLQTLKRLRFSK